MGVNLAPALLLAVLAQAAAWRALARYAPVPELTIPGLLFITAALAWVMLNPQPWVRKKLNSAWPLALVVVALSVAIVLVYPLADGLKLQGGGSDADDALRIGGHALWQFQNPYGLTTYFGNPLSPGPGWLFLTGWLAVLGLQPLLTPLALLLCAWALRASGFGWPMVSIVVLMLASSLGLWELAVVGNDLPAWGLLLLAVVALLTKPRLPFLAVIGLAVVVGCLATARLPLFYLPILLGFALIAVWPLRGVWVAGVGLLMMVAWHGWFYLLNGAGYPPLHLLGRGEALLAGSSLVAALGVLGVTGVAMLYHWRWWPPLTQVALGLGVPFAVLAAAELASVGTLEGWEGATFLLPALPMALLAVLKAWPPSMHNTLTPRAKAR